MILLKKERKKEKLHSERERGKVSKGVSERGERREINTSSSTQKSSNSQQGRERVCPVQFVVC